jgi:uncharacterized cupin superfamily protein
MTLRKPALNPQTLPARTVTLYPEPYRSLVLPREKRALGDALGLTKVGINHTKLMPGKVSSMRHWHTEEDEFIFVLEGEVVLCTDDGEQVLRAGDCAGFPAGSKDGHQLANRGTAPAVYLEVSNRDRNDTAHYSDPNVDMVWDGGRGCILHRDGSDY